MFGDRDPLDTLLLKAMDDQARRKFKKAPTLIIQREERVKESFKALYLSPENWQPGKITILIHRSPQGEHTLLGTFQQLHHIRHRKIYSGKDLISRTGALKLVRCESPTAPEEEMFVTGEHWLHDIAPKLPEFPDNPEGIADHQLVFDLQLGDLQVEAKQAQIEVRTEHGWTRRVLLRDTTQFFCPTNRVMIFLPKGLDVLEAMSFDCKRALKERLAR